MREKKTILLLCKCCDKLIVLEIPLALAGGVCRNCSASVFHGLILGIQPTLWRLSQDCVLYLQLHISMPEKQHEGFLLSGLQKPSFTSRHGSDSTLN